MKKDENFFQSLSDKEFLIVLNEFEEYNHTRMIPDGSILAKARDIYCKRHGAQGLIVMQFELLFVCANRLRERLREELGQA